MQPTPILLFTLLLVHYLHGRRISRSVTEGTSSSPAINKFASRVSQQISQTAPSTYLWSPFSIYQTLVPLCYAADGTTRQELEAALATRGCPGEPHQDVSSKSLSFVTGLFTQVGIPLNPQVVQDIDKNTLNLHVDPVNFKEDAVLKINSWVKDSTGGLISQVVDSSLNPETVLMIVNCVKFDAHWLHPFPKELTKIETFHGKQGPQEVKMMKQTGYHLFSRFSAETLGDSDSVDFSVVEMAYVSDNTAAIFMLPENPDQLIDVLNYVNKKGLPSIRRSLGWREIDLSLPKFRITSDIQLESVLSQAGIPSIFTSQANFSRLFLNSSTSPSVSKIVHTTVFETSEKGTSAAAVSAISLVPLSALPQSAQRIVFNKPFAVFIIGGDNTILFQGAVSDLIGQQLNFEEPIDRSWWIPKKVPAYLVHNFTESEESALPQPANTFNNVPKQVAQFTKYQQPEPKDPTGIRFPATIMLEKTHSMPKPRSNNQLYSHLNRF